MMNGYAMSGWGWLLMTLGMLGFWALVAVLALALLRRPGPPNQQPQPGQQPRPGAEEILAERLAHGEIDPDEYRQRLQILQETTQPAMTQHPQPTWPPHGFLRAPGQPGPGSNLAVVLRVLGHRHKLRQRDRWTHQRLQAYQARALRQLREHAYAHSPFYQRFHAGRTDRPLHELPVLTKAMVMEHFDQLVTDEGGAWLTPGRWVSWVRPTAPLTARITVTWSARAATTGPFGCCLGLAEVLAWRCPAVGAAQPTAIWVVVCR